MKLLTFAHRGEAQTFISRLDVTPVDDSQTLFLGNDYAILLTGEGVYDCLVKLASVIAQYKPKLIINYGIAGALTHKLTLNQIYPVRTVYGYESEKPVFKSYSTESNGTFDCITSWRRVLTKDYAEQLAPFAEIVDREAWACGKVATQTLTPFRIYKLISDYAGEDTDCFDLKQRAQQFSELMWEHFLKERDHFKVNTNPIKSELELPFHASFTQRKQIQKLAAKIAQSDLEEIINESENAHACITNLTIAIHPLQAEIQKRLDEIKKPFHEIGANLKFDPKLENKKVLLQMEINSKKNLINLIQALENFDYQKLEDFWDGKFNV